MSKTSKHNASAFGVGAIVGVLGGLIGLGGAEFRLPLLAGWFRFSLLLAILINLLISLATVTVSLVFRAHSQGLDPIFAQWPVAVNILLGSLPGSFVGVNLASRISERTLLIVVASVLVFLLMGHDWLFAHGPLVLSPLARYVLGFLAGVVIGGVSSLLGVAGGELIIPTLAIFFALGIKIAGSVSLMISIPTIIMGIVRYRSNPVFSELRLHRGFIASMALGSVIGAWVGSLLLPYISSVQLQVLLGVILLISAAKLGARKRSDQR